MSIAAVLGADAQEQAAIAVMAGIQKDFRIMFSVAWGKWTSPVHMTSFSED